MIEEVLIKEYASPESGIHTKTSNVFQDWLLALGTFKPKEKNA